MEEKDAAERIKGSYILTYQGSEEEFKLNYYEKMLKNSLEAAGYINLTTLGQTIVMIKDHGSKDDLEDRLSMFRDDEKIVLEREQVYKAQ